MTRKYKNPRLTLNITAEPTRVAELRAVGALVHVLSQLSPWNAQARVIAAALVLLGEPQSKIDKALYAAKG
jgi:hypothetical protein